MALTDGERAMIALRVARKLYLEDERFGATVEQIHEGYADGISDMWEYHDDDGEASDLEVLVGDFAAYLAGVYMGQSSARRYQDALREAYAEAERDRAWEEATSHVVRTILTELEGITDRQERKHLIRTLPSRVKNFMAS